MTIDIHILEKKNPSGSGRVLPAQTGEIDLLHQHTEAAAERFSGFPESRKVSERPASRRQMAESRREAAEEEFICIIIVLYPL